MFSLESKIAIVTGGAKGIGEATCRVFVQQGATVHLLDIDMLNARKVVSELGAPCEAHHCDVTDPSAVMDTINKIAQAHDSLDILVNNAGAGHIGSLDATTEEDMDRMYTINVKSVYYGMLAALPHMKKSGGGSIINLSSIVSTVGIPDRFAYSTSKGAVAAMTRSMAVDGLKDGIRCNSVAPARVNTPFVDAYLEKYYPDTKEEMFNRLSKAQPIGRMATPEEVAALICYLASDESAFLTGVSLPMDGGAFTLQP
ncbi:MAG: SDR family NAD(P)-dependent oxidoreductase [Bacteroidetes bacterium]|nr:SDR family NAD(P)-dependent oxidoreductase [Bacteroidota bacterium]